MYIFRFPVLHFLGISLCLNMYVSASVYVSCVFFFDSFTSVCLFCLIMLLFSYF